MDFESFVKMKAEFGDINMSQLMKLARLLQTQTPDTEEPQVPAPHGTHGKMLPLDEVLPEEAFDQTLRKKERPLEALQVKPAIPHLTPSRRLSVTRGTSGKMHPFEEVDRSRPEKEKPLREAQVTPAIPHLTPSRRLSVTRGTSSKMHPFEEALQEVDRSRREKEKPLGGAHLTPSRNRPSVLRGTSGETPRVETNPKEPKPLGSRTGELKPKSKSKDLLDRSRHKVRSSSSGNRASSGSASGKRPLKSGSAQPPANEAYAEKIVATGSNHQIPDQAPDGNGPEKEFAKFLKSKNLESYLEILASHRITSLERFSRLAESDVDSFCSVLLDKVEFRNMLRQLKPTNSEETGEFLADVKKKYGSFREWLASQTLALDILDSYEKTGAITNSQQNVIVQIVLSAANHRGIKFNDTFYRNMASSIVSTFGGAEHTYYRPSYKTEDGKRVPPTGKLVKRKKSALIKPAKMLKANDGAGKSAGMIENLNQQSAAREWLVNGRTPKEMVLDQWRLCYELRQNDIKATANLKEVLDMYPIIKLPIGADLIISDFDEMFPNATNNFFLKFPKLHEVLKPFLKNANKSQKNEQRYQMYKKAPIGSPIRDLLLCYFLPLIIQTDYKVKGSNWRPTVTDVQKYFLMEIMTAGDLNTKTDALIQDLANSSKMTPLQPHVVAVGPIENAAFLVIFGGSQYAAESIQHAIALCLQICFVLDLEYSFESFPVWCFLQLYLFQIPLRTPIPKSCDKLLKALAKA